MLGSPQRIAQAYTYAERYTQGSHVEKKKPIPSSSMEQRSFCATPNQMEAKMTLFWPLLSNGGLWL